MPKPSHFTSLLHKYEKGQLTEQERSSMPSRSNIDQMAEQETFATEYADQIMYEGFDPNLIYMMLLAAAGDPAVLKKDLVDMSVAFLIRGNNISKMINSMSETGRMRLLGLKSRYNLVDSVKKSVNRRKAITLARACMTFPLYSLMALIKLPKRYYKPMRPCLNKIHVVIRTQVLVAYHTEEVASHVSPLSLACGVIQGAVIGDNKDTLGGLKGFVNAAKSSSRIDLNKVLEMMKSVGIDKEPLNWVGIKARVTNLLKDSRNSDLLTDLASELAPILSELVPPVEWVPYLSEDGHILALEDYAHNPEWVGLVAQIPGFQDQPDSEDA